MEIVWTLLICVAIGLTAGVVGGIAGIGGSIIMLPALVLIFGRGPGDPSHHVYQGAAMIVNAVVAYATARNHFGTGRIRRPLFAKLWPSMAIVAVTTVWFSRAVPGFWPRLGLAAFIIGFCVYNVVAAIRKSEDPSDDAETTSTGLLVGIGALCGAAAGFLAIGGGILMVPLLQLTGRVQLKRAIATSAAVMSITAPIAAAMKMGTLVVEGEDWSTALLLAAGMAAGGMFGAKLGVLIMTKLSLPNLRLAISAILAVVAARMAWQEIGGRRDAPSPSPTPPAQVQPAPAASPG
ncbi:MAG: sulfite exporter TauE/SafE family protein [Phycisphaerales bacterium]